MVAVFIGRFQPVHRGHIHTIRQILSEEGELIIAIGSAQYSHTPDNPFSGGERVMFLHHALIEEGIDMSRVYIVPVPDIHIHPLWVAHLKSLTPYFDRAYTHNPLVRRLLEDAGVEVCETKLLERSRFSAEHVRELLRQGGNWEALVPPSVAALIKKHKMDERVRAIGDTRLKR